MLNYTIILIKPLCPTRWTVRTQALFIVLKNYSVLQDELDNIGQHSSGDASSKAKGLFTNMEQFQTFWGFVLYGICCYRTTSNNSTK